MKIAIMQPYFLPYIGYFQLISAVDRFVVYDNIKYTKKGWINRNRILANNEDVFITLPLKQDSDSLNVDARYLSASFPEEKAKLLRKVRECYRKAPEFDAVFPLVSDIIDNTEGNLFHYIYSSLRKVSHNLGIQTEFIISSTLPIDHALRSQDKVLAICSALGADTYVNPIGGTELYKREAFERQGLSLKFLKSDDIRYPQFGGEFVPWLSILDVMMFNSPAEISRLLGCYSLI